MPTPSLFGVEEFAFATNHVPVEERFWAKVKKTESCWLWIGAKARKGRGVLWLNDHNVAASRISWELHFGKPPNNLCVP